MGLVGSASLSGLWTTGGSASLGVRHTPTHSALPNWREPVAHPLTTRMSSNLGFRVINPLASPTLGGTSCASDRVGWPNLSFRKDLRARPLGHADNLGVAPRKASGRLATPTLRAFGPSSFFLSKDRSNRACYARHCAALGRPRQAAQPLAHPRGDPAARTPRRSSCGERPGEILRSAERASFGRFLLELTVLYWSSNGIDAF